MQAHTGEIIWSILHVRHHEMCWISVLACASLNRYIGYTIVLSTVAVFVVLQFCSAWLVAVGCSNCAGAVVIGMWNIHEVEIHRDVYHNHLMHLTVVLPYKAKVDFVPLEGHIMVVLFCKKKKSGATRFEVTSLEWSQSWKVDQGKGSSVCMGSTRVVLRILIVGGEGSNCNWHIVLSWWQICFDFCHKNLWQ